MVIAVFATDATALMAEDIEDTYSRVLMLVKKSGGEYVPGKCVV
jgi:hypothetical protein